MNRLEKFRDITTFIFDVDGVITNGELLILENGQLLRKIKQKDCDAMTWLIDKGYKIAIITGSISSGLIHQLQQLGITDIYKGVRDKIEAYESFVRTYDLSAENILYMGDDLPDLRVMRRVGLPTCPIDATEEVKQIAQYISPAKGGKGCVRDVIEKVLKLQGKWNN